MMKNVKKTGPNQLQPAFKKTGPNQLHLFFAVFCGPGPVF
jgi:hypothetical protein